MKTKIKKYEEKSPVEFLLLRERFGFKRFRKHKKRDAEERMILLEIGLKKIKEEEKKNFIPLGYRRRRFKIL